MATNFTWILVGHSAVECKQAASRFLQEKDWETLIALDRKTEDGLATCCWASWEITICLSGTSLRTVCSSRSPGVGRPQSHPVQHLLSAIPAIHHILDWHDWVRVCAHSNRLAGTYARLTFSRFPFVCITDRLHPFITLVDAVINMSPPSFSHWYLTSMSYFGLQLDPRLPNPVRPDTRNPPSSYKFAAEHASPPPLAMAGSVLPGISCRLGNIQAHVPARI